MSWLRVPALPAALRQDGPLAPGSTLVWRQGEQVRVQRALLQGEEQVPRAGLPGEQRALVGLPVLVPDERRALVGLRVLVPGERQVRVLLPDGSQVPPVLLQALAPDERREPVGLPVLVPGEGPVLRLDDLLHFEPGVGPVELQVELDAPVVDLGELRVRRGELRGELQAVGEPRLDERQGYPPPVDPDVLRRGVPSHAGPGFGHLQALGPGRCVPC